MRNMNSARGSFSAVCLSTLDYIYAVGGAGSDGHPINKVERYDVAKEKWESVAPLHVARLALTSSVVTI